jgi:hypothetical protein
LREFRERQFTANVLAHHLDDFFYSFIQCRHPGEMFLHKPILNDDGHTSTLHST